MNLAQPDSGERIVKCRDGKYCCGNDAPNCCTNRTVDKFDLPNPVIFATIGELKRPNLNTNTPSRSSTLILPISKSTSVFNSISTSVINATSITNYPATSPTRGPEKTTGEKSSMVVGLGVGIPLGILLVGVVAGCIWWMQRTRRAFEQREEQMRAEIKIGKDKFAELSGISTTIHELPLKHIYELPLKHYSYREEMPG